MHQPVSSALQHYSADLAPFFEAALYLAAQSVVPTLIGTIDFPVHAEALLAEGRARQAMNALRMGAKYVNTQSIKDCPLTSDELGRLAEGAIEQLLPLTAAAVVEGTDARPDLMIEDMRFDIKSAYARPGNSFAVSQYRARKYDALVLVQLTREGALKVWCCKCDPEAGRWELRIGKPNFYLLKCPDAAPAPELVH